MASPLFLTHQMLNVEGFEAGTVHAPSAAAAALASHLCDLALPESLCPGGDVEEDDAFDSVARAMVRAQEPALGFAAELERVRHLGEWALRALAELEAAECLASRLSDSLTGHWQALLHPSGQEGVAKGASLAPAALDAIEASWRETHSVRYGHAGPSAASRPMDSWGDADLRDYEDIADMARQLGALGHAGGAGGLVMRDLRDIATSCCVGVLAAMRLHDRDRGIEAGFTPARERLERAAMSPLAALEGVLSRIEAPAPARPAGEGGPFRSASPSMGG